MIHLNCPACGSKGGFRSDRFHVRGQFCLCGWRRDPVDLSDSCPICRDGQLVAGRLFVWCSNMPDRCQYSTSRAEYEQDKQIESALLRGEFED